MAEDVPRGAGRTDENVSQPSTRVFTVDERAPEPGMENEAVEPEVFEQDGPDLFGDEESPRPVMPPDEATPDDDLPSDPCDPGLLDGPETPEEPDGLETDEDEEDGADVIERVQELIGEAPVSYTHLRAHET